MWEIINFEKEYFNEMIEMTKEYYGSDNDISNSDFVVHEYFNNPEGDAFVKFAYDFENRKMAGQYIVLPKEFLINGKKCKAVLSLNTLTREAYRGQQVFTKLAESVYSTCGDAGVKFCYGAPNQNSFPGFIKKLSFKNMGYMPLYLKIRNPFRILQDKLRIGYAYSDEMFFGVDGIRSENVRIISIDKSNIRLFDELWEALSEEYKVIGIRNAEYIKWRYFDLPRRDYRILMAMENGKPVGYIIGRITDVAQMRCGMVVDFLFKNGNQEIGTVLLKEIEKCFKVCKIGLIGCLMQNGTKEAEVLKKNGFFVCPDKLLPQPFPIIYRQFNDLPQGDDEMVQDFNNWFFTMGDYDVI